MKIVKDMMTTEVISTYPDAPIVEAVNKLFKYRFNGLPVIDANDNLVGILTEFDLVIKGSSVYLPTFLQVLNEVDLYKKDKKLISEDLKRILNTRVKDIMNVEPLTIHENVSLEDAVKTFAEHHKVNPIPVVDDNKKVVGIISRSDLIRFFNISSLKNINLNNEMNQRQIDKDVAVLLKDLRNQFTLVRKSRTHRWLIVSISFAIVGYAIAWFLIIRIV